MARVKKLIRYELELYYNTVQKHQNHSSNNTNHDDTDDNTDDLSLSIPAITISSDCPYIFSKACEYLIYDLTIHAWNHTVVNNRCTLQRYDIYNAIHSCSRFDFLQELILESQHTHSNNIRHRHSNETELTDDEPDDE